MINILTVINHRGESLELNMRSPEQSGFFIQSVDGLEPTKATIGMTDLSGWDGAIFTSARATFRNIVISLGFTRDPMVSVETRRQQLYRLFPNKKEVQLLIEMENRTVAIYGRVENIDSPSFVKEPTAQISIICPDPRFVDLVSQETLFTGVTGIFTFPFSNNSLTEKLMSFGIVTTSTVRNIFYPGEADTGFLISIHLTGSVTNLVIQNQATGEYLKILNSVLTGIGLTGLLAGDDIVVSTISGSKYIYLTRSGVTYNIVNALDKGSTWLKLTYGDNPIVYQADSGVGYVMFTVFNSILYEGV